MFTEQGPDDAGSEGVVPRKAASARERRADSRQLLSPAEHRTNTSTHAQLGPALLAARVL
jgi:hypothetical protein